MTDKKKENRGGRREGAGRKPRHEKPMVQKSLRLPEEWIVDLVDEFGTFQKAIETLVEQHLSS